MFEDTLEMKMAKIEFRENKVLKLINVLSKEVPTKGLFSHEKHVIMLQNWIKTKGYDTIGPLIMYSSSFKRSNEDLPPTIDSKVMLQLKQDSIKLEKPYEFTQQIRVENCLMARFNGKDEDLHYAIMKLQVFSYENNVELTGEIYIILISEGTDCFMADIFMPVKVMQ